MSKGWQGNESRAAGSVVGRMRNKTLWRLLTLTKPQLIQALQQAWNDGYTKGHDHGEDNAPPSCKRAI